MKSSKLILIFCLIILASACNDKEDEEPIACLVDAETIQDVDGNCYKIVKIGEQWWMAENLRTSKKRDGSEIREMKSVNEWSSPSMSGETDSKYIYFENNSQNNSTYGKLYNTAAICCNICPTGWKLPEILDWGILLTFLKETGMDGTNLKIKSGWPDNEFTGDNESGFSAYPAGGVSGRIGFFPPNNSTAWWTSSVDNLGYRSIYFMTDNGPNLLHTYSFEYGEGYSIRCVKE